jgi:hypothetical protein
MHATSENRRMRARRKAIVIFTATVMVLSMFGGAVQAANSRDFTVTLSDPTPVSAGGATKFDVVVDSDDNQTIANVHLSVPATSQTWPGGVTISTVFGPDASMCAPSNGTSLSCDFGNIAGFGTRTISIVVNVAETLPAGDITFSASAETNNENGANLQVESGTATAEVQAFNDNTVSTFNLGGPVSTSPLGTGGAGNLQTTINLLQNNGGNGNVVQVSEGTDAVQPAYCVALKLTCQPDFTEVAVNAGSAVSPYLETVLTANVPKSYNVKKAFVIHVLDNGTVETGFPLFNEASTSCAAHPSLVPCADFSLSKANNVLTIVLHTFGNGRMSY